MKKNDLSYFNSLNFLFNEKNNEIILSLKFKALELTFNKCLIKLKTKNFYQKYFSFIEDLIPKIFWNIHYFFFQKKKDFFSFETSNKWKSFLFCLETDLIEEKELIQQFLKTFPYFISELLFNLYMILTNEIEEFKTEDFRLKICDHIVFFFTSVHLLDTQLSDNFYRFFHKLPINKKPQEETENSPIIKEEEIKSVLILKEDPKKIKDIETRIHPKKVQFQISGVSPSISLSYKHSRIPYSYDSKISILYPKNGSQDWTLNLPKLPHVKKSISSPIFDPNNDPSSLILRARRPNAYDDYTNLKQDYLKKKKDREISYKKVHNNIIESNIKAKVCEPETLSKFIHSLRILQKENKRDETPEFTENEEILNKKVYILTNKKNQETKETKEFNNISSFEDINETLKNFKEKHDQLSA